MKKILLPFMILLLMLSLLGTAGCKKKDDNITFEATIQEIHDNSILVSTTDDVGFDLASVGFDKDVEININFLEGQKVSITILPEVRESYPVQVTAVAIKLAE